MAAKVYLAKAHLLDNGCGSSPKKGNSYTNINSINNICKAWTCSLIDLQFICILQKLDKNTCRVIKNICINESNILEN